MQLLKKKENKNKGVSTLLTSLLKNRQKGICICFNILLIKKQAAKKRSILHFNITLKTEQKGVSSFLTCPIKNRLQKGGFWYSPKNTQKGMRDFVKTPQKL